jgi:hypothetical protein
MRTIIPPIRKQAMSQPSVFLDMACYHRRDPDVYQERMEVYILEGKRQGMAVCRRRCHR